MKIALFVLPIIRFFLKKVGCSGGNKKAHRWYASFCGGLTFRFNFGTFRSGGVARFVLRIIHSATSVSIP